MAYSFKAVWRKGVTNQDPDALSRNPVSAPSPEESFVEDDGDNQEPSAAEIRAIHVGNWKVYDYRNLENLQNYTRN